MAAEDDELVHWLSREYASVCNEISWNDERSWLGPNVGTWKAMSSISCGPSKSGSFAIFTGMRRASGRFVMRGRFRLV